MTFSSDASFKYQVIAAVPWFLIMTILRLFVTNKQADWSENCDNNKLSKSGIYSLFVAFRNNELLYRNFYRTIPKNEVYNYVKSVYIASDNSFFKDEENSIYSSVKSGYSINNPIKPNVIFICIESLSGNLLKGFGGKRMITLVLDALSIPTTPGRSIEKWKNNQGLFTIGEYFKKNKDIVAISTMEAMVISII